MSLIHCPEPTSFFLPTFFCIIFSRQQGSIDPVICVLGSVADPCHFEVDPDPDPRIHASD